MLKQLQSDGELENDERIANVVSDLVRMTDKIDPNTPALNDSFNKISITYPDHCYVICLSNKKIHVLKKTLKPATIIQQVEPTEEQLVDL